MKTEGLCTVTPIYTVNVDQCSHVDSWWHRLPKRYHAPRFPVTQSKQTPKNHMCTLFRTVCVPIVTIKSIVITAGSREGSRRAKGMEWMTGLKSMPMYSQWTIFFIDENLCFCHVMMWALVSNSIWHLETSV